MRKLVSLLAIVVGCGAACARSTDDDSRAIRTVHEQILQAHRNRDPIAWTNLEAETVTVASRGELILAKRQDRLAMRERYLGATRFSVYRDLQEPIVRVSADGSLGWLIAKVEVVAHPVTAATADSSHSVWAWVELYEKRAGRWLMVGNVSNERVVPIRVY